VNRARNIRIRWFLAVGVIAAALALLAYALEGFQDWELDAVDARFDVRGDQDPPDDIVLVLVNDVTFDELDQRWPFPRAMHADLTDQLREAGAKVIAFDIQFSEASDVGGAGSARAAEDDLVFANAIAAAANVVISVTELDERGDALLFGTEDLKDFPEPSIYADLLARPGSANLPNDPGGVRRRFEYAPQGLESLAVVAAECESGTPPGPDEERSRCEGGKQISKSDFTEEDDSAWIDFHGPAFTIPSVSYSRVLRGQADPDFLKDKIVVIGASAPSLQDLAATSTTRSDEEMPGPEIQANAISTVLRDFPLKSAPDWLDVLLIVLLAFAGPLLSLRFGALVSLVTPVVLGLLFAVAAQLAFNGGMILAFIYPIGALAISLIGTALVHYTTSVFERQRVRDMFSRFVPENVVDDVLARSDGLRLGGVQRAGTVMFSDLRGFTSFAESLPVDRVIDVLNRYLSEMSDAILDSGGTLVAYMGDGIMAVFGAPVEQPDHADRALEAARAMMGARLETFNDYLRSEGLSEEGFRMGIGLNSGPVMSGNVGSERRLEYTAIGDTTNTAARLEGMTKGTPHMLFLAQSTVDVLQNEQPDLVYVGEFEVRGRQQKIRLWSVEEAETAPTAPAGATATT
jgi:adenylate cyclase